ncbi:LCP family protein [Virgibacillus sp. YIM 98842]|uniref:LCP family protein n=1 Tax=Virgibacillus sp. YIM 98842 TaxID=2663533 RepID=UPI0013DB08F6|nr:LCP family protein [Virgibacillus sp. YIM 98842]
MAKQKGRLKKWILIIGIPLIFLLSIAAGYAAYLYNKTEDLVTESYDDTGRENETSDMREEKVDPVEDHVSVLLLGVDNSAHRDEEVSRTDAMVLATFNRDNQSIKLLSIPRDTYVYIPEVGYHSKINHAHAYGGPRASMETVEHFLEIPVDYFVRMNFDGFVEVVDALDGIMVDVPYEFQESDSRDKRDSIHLFPGYQEVNGEEALALARTRDHDNDVERGKRQQEILEAIADKATSASSILKLEEVITAIGSNMQTNFSFKDLQSFVSYGLAEDLSIEMINFDGEGTYLDDGGWYYIVEEDNLSLVGSELRRHLDLQSHQDISDYVEDDGETVY